MSLLLLVVCLAATTGLAVAPGGFLLALVPLFGAVAAGAWLADRMQFGPVRPEGGLVPERRGGTRAQVEPARQRTRIERRQPLSI
jgi:hypothetical protein